MKQLLLLTICIFPLISSCGKESNTPQKSATQSTVKAPIYELSSKLPGSEVDSTLFQSQAVVFDNNDPGWMLTFSDEFDSKEIAIAKGKNPECFSKTPTCMINWWARTDCQEYSTQLADLNKCNWDVYHYYNYMDWDAPEGTGINAFNPNQVKVQNGTLILSAEKSNFSRISCKVKFLDPRVGFDNYTFECPIISGGVESRRHGNNNQYGFTQKFGRFEVRAKLNHGPGSWPAHWLLPEEAMEPGCGWPYSGEIDIMEATFLNKNVAGSNFHTGDCQKKTHVSSGFNWSVTKENYPNVIDLENNFYDSFHTYAVEWDENKFRFFYDDHFLGQVNENDIIFPEGAPDGHKIIIPKKPFYWILNNTIFNANDPSKVDVNNFARQEHVIDYVKVYRKCTPQDDSSKCVKVNYKNTMATCPGIRTDIGDYKSKNLCKAWPHFSISLGNCYGNSGELATISSGEYAGEWCAINEGTWFKARKVSRECPLGYDKVGSKGYLPVCKAWVSFGINRSNCDGEFWSNSGTEYCLWNHDGWYKARKIK
jgi:beta-glucanase (GH16 family)